MYSMKNLAKTGYIICLFLILALFCYFRVKPVYFQTVPYTFDQGRDFLKTQEIVIDKQPALLGPTTGISGVNHGVWWYYFLTIPFFVTNGNPMGFYYFILLLALAQLVLFTVFLKKEFGKIASLVFAALVALGPYFIKTSIFAINSVLAPPALLAFLYFYYKKEFGKIASLVFAALVALGPYFIKTSIFAINSVLAPPALLAFLYFYYKYTVKKDLRILFLVGFSLSMVFEAEVAFGLFLYPSFFLAILILKRLKDFLGTKKRFLYFVSGLLLPIAPRILFELKSGFSQTQLVLKYFNETSVQAYKTYSEVFWERFHLLKDFFLQSFPGQIQFLMWSTLCLIIIGIFFSFYNLKKLRKEFFLFTLILFVGLFVLSLLYKTVFWQNYFEGLPYFFVVFSALSVSALLRSQKTVLKIIVYVYVVVLILSLGTTFAQELQNKESPKLEGLREHMEVS